MKAFIEVKIANTDEFEKLLAEFTQKARELEELAHKLNTFRFTGEIAASSSRDAVTKESSLPLDPKNLNAIGSAIHDTLSTAQEK